MSWASRVLLGALLGALIIPFFSPHMRLYLMQGLTQFKPPTALKALQISTDLSAPVGDPTDKVSAALWLRRYAQAIAEGQKIPMDSHLTYTEIAQTAAVTEPDNAFWHQMEAVGQEMLGHQVQADAALIRASQAQRWTDYQQIILSDARATLRERHGAYMAWHYAALAEWRSDSAAEALDEAFLKKNAGRAIPEKARHGLELLFRAQTTYDGRNAAARLLGKATQRDPRLYSDNFNRRTYWKVMRLETVGVATAPGAFMLSLLLFILIAVKAWVWETVPALTELLGRKTSIVSAIIMMVIVYLLTRLVLPTLLAGISVAAFGFDTMHRPFFARAGQRLIRFLHQDLWGAVMAILVALAAMSATTAAQACRLTQQAEWPWYLTPVPLIGAVVCGFFVWFAFVPAVAASQGRASEEMVGPAMMRMARGGLVTAAALAVIAAPITVLLERMLLLNLDRHFWFG